MDLTVSGPLREDISDGFAWNIPSWNTSCLAPVFGYYHCCLTRMKSARIVGILYSSCWAFLWNSIAFNSFTASPKQTSQSYRNTAGTTTFQGAYNAFHWAISKCLTEGNKRLSLSGEKNGKEHDVKWSDSTFAVAMPKPIWRGKMVSSMQQTDRHGMENSTERQTGLK